MKLREKILLFLLIGSVILSSVLGGATGPGIHGKSGNIAFDGAQSLFSDGTATAPSISFSGQTGTGLSRSANQLAFSVDGAMNLRVDNGGNFVVRGGLFIGGGSTDLTTNLDTILVRDAANTLAQRNGTNAQEFRLYNTDSGANDEFLSIGAINNANVYTFESEATGTGTIRPFAFMGASLGIGEIAPATLVQLTGASTPTLYIESTTASDGGRFILEDTDGAGCSQATVLNGVVTWATVTCP